MPYLSYLKHVTVVTTHAFMGESAYSSQTMTVVTKHAFMGDSAYSSETVDLIAIHLPHALLYGITVTMEQIPRHDGSLAKRCRIA